MAEQQTIKYAPQWNNMTVDNVIFQTNNVVVVYQNFLREFWSTAVAFGPFPSTDKPEKRPLKEFLIKFLVSNGQRPLTLDFKTFCSSTGLDYNNDKYVDHPTPEGPEASGALSKKSKRPTSKKPPTKTKVTPPKPTKGSEQSHSVSSGTVPDPQDLERDIQLASMGLPSILNEGTCKSQPLPESTATHPKDSEGNKQPLDMDITFTTSDEGIAKTMLRPKGSRGDKDSKGNKPSTDMKPQNPTDADLSETVANYRRTRPNVRAILLSEDEAQESEEGILGAGEEMDNNPQSAKTQHQFSPPHKDKHTSSIALHAEASDIDSSSDKTLKNTTINDLYKVLKVITQLLEDIINSIKDDPSTNKKIKEASETLAKISTLLLRFSLLSGALISLLFSLLISGLERVKTHIKSSMSFLQEDTISIKSMMTEMYNAFRGKSFLAPSSSIALKFALIDTPVNVKGENTTHTATKEPPSHTKRETDANIQEKPEEPKQSTNANIEFIGSSTHLLSITQAQSITIIHPESFIAQREGKGIATDDQAKDQRKLVNASSIVRPDPDEPVREEEIKKAEEKARLNAIRKTKVIKVVREEAKKLGIHLKEAITTKAEQAISQTSGRKRKHMELDPETRIPGIECNQALPENVLFVNNMVIEEPEYGIFFTNEFSDQAFQRCSDIDKVGMEALVSYIVAAFMVKSPENARFILKLRKLIAEHPDQEKLKSKKVKLEALGYKIE
uniref:Uncharacterized protein n=1 Tax=Tanacetum cinerariifolium TaxID=118510 RepID=A0A699HFE9_TANCI|nr:hypothetical protein [Tanacetum cinerariifolium]